MNKEEYAELHYLLAKLKYELLKMLEFTTNEKYINEINRQIKEIEDIEKIMIIGENNE